MRRVQRFHDLRQRRAAAVDAEPGAGLSEAGRLVAEGLEKARDAVAAVGRADQHWHYLTLAQLAREVLEDPVARRLDVGKELFHEAVVVVGEPLQHGEAGLLLARQLA